MSGSYRKEGVSTIVSLARGIESVARVAEGGMAGVREGRFFAASLDPAAGPEATPDPGPLVDLLRTIGRSLPGDVELERMTLMAGASAHEIDFEPGARRWNEAHCRLHLTLRSTRTRLEVPLLRGGARTDDLELRELVEVAALLARPRAGVPRVATLELAPAVMAELAASLAVLDDLPAGVRLRQTSHPAWPFDGAGAEIVAFEASAGGRRPNVFRPSYRSPAVPAMFHVEIPVGGEEARGEVAAVEPIGSARWSGGSVRLDALCAVDGGGFAARIEIPAAGMARLSRSPGERQWFPLRAGAWGTGAVVERARIRPW